MLRPVRPNRLPVAVTQRPASRLTVDPVSTLACMSIPRYFYNEKPRGPDIYTVFDISPIGVSVAQSKSLPTDNHLCLLDMSRRIECFSVHFTHAAGKSLEIAASWTDTDRSWEGFWMPSPWIASRPATELPTTSTNNTHLSG